MWINYQLFHMILDDNKLQALQLGIAHKLQAEASERCAVLREQKVKDDLWVEWLRHRVNALEKQNTVLMGKVTGLHFATPEIVPTRPGTMGGVPDFDSLPSFEDVGEVEAVRLGLSHDLDGNIIYGSK